MLRIVGPATAEGDARGWIDVVDPTPTEIARLRDDHGIPEELMAHALDIDERPRVENQNEVTLVVLQVPHAQRDGAPALPYVTLPFGIFLAGPWLVTVSPRETEVLERVRAFAALDWQERTHHRFILHTFIVVAHTYLAHLSAINHQVDAIEEQLSTSLQNREVLVLLRYQKALIYYGTALRSCEMLLQHLQRRPAFHIPDEDVELLDDAMVEIRQAIDVATVSGNILGEMMDAFASIISNNLNMVMKFLAAMTVVLAFPMIVASFYGMNVRLPVQDHHQAFAILLGVSLILSMGVTFWFLRKRWL
jgi:magnesium transporter